MKTPFILLSVFIFSCCTKTTKKDDFYYLVHDYSTYNAVQIDTLITDFSSSEKDSVYTLNYHLHNFDHTDTITYLLKDDINFIPQEVVNGELTDKDQFVMVFKEDFAINDVHYPVCKYCSYPLVVDGTSTYFWTPRLGVFLIRSTTWRNMRILYSSNEQFNREVNTLCRMLWQKADFYFGGIERMNLIPESDAIEFYKWRMVQYEKDDEIY